MNPRGDVLERYESMQFELRTFFYRNAQKRRCVSRRLFKRVLETVKAARHLDDIDIRYLQCIALKAFESDSDSLQTLTFEFTKKLINVFARSKPKYRRGHIITELLSFYSTVVFRSSRRPELISRASGHAANLCSIQSPYRLYALRAFDLTCFANFPLGRFKGDAIENLLRITSEKIMSYTDLDPLVPAVVKFLSEVVETCCGFRSVDQICLILCQLLGLIARHDSIDDFATIRSSDLFQWALSHVTFPKGDRTCWEAVARLMKEAFKYADAPTKNSLVDIGVFQRVREMFRDHRREVIAHLLDFVTEVCSGPDLLYINHALNYNVIVLIVPFIGHRLHATNIQQKATRALSTFLRNSATEQIHWAIADGILPPIFRLLKSKNEHAVAVTLRCLFILIEKLGRAEEVESFAEFETSFIQARGGECLMDLFAHRNLYVSRSATIIYERFVRCRNGQVGADTAWREANRRFILETDVGLYS